MRGLPIRAPSFKTPTNISPMQQSQPQQKKLIKIKLQFEIRATQSTQEINSRTHNAKKYGKSIRSFWCFQDNFGFSY